MIETNHDLLKEQKVYDVFISYSSKDQKIAEGICAYLEQRHIFRSFRWHHVNTN